MMRGLIAGALLASTGLLALPAAAQVSIGISVHLAPPPLPVYAQPPLPGPDYLWTPGYWAWDDDVGAYFWVPGTWVRAPRPGLLWTPPWWGWSDGLYVFHSGYWGPHIGFYGGVAYGFGYTGFGYQGGYWNGGHVFYNRTVTNITNANVTNVYQRNVTVNRVSQVSYNGGPGGVQARPAPQEQAAAREPHIGATAGQQAHLAAAHADPRAFASANHGRPPMAATPRPMGAPGGPGARPAAAHPPAAADTAQRFGGNPGRPGPGGGGFSGGSADRPLQADAARPPQPPVHRPDTMPHDTPRPQRPPAPPHNPAPPHQPPRPHPQPKPAAPHPHPPAHEHEEHH